MFKPHVVVLNFQHQKTGYENHKEKCAEYIMQHEYQASDRKFHQVHHHQIYIKKIMFDFCTDTSPDVFEETCCAVCVKLTSIF